MMTTRRVCWTVVLTAAIACPGFAADAPEKATTQPARPHEGQDPDHVEFGIYVLDIDEISGHKQSFAANFYLRLRWKDERLAHSGPFARVLPLAEVWHPPVVLTNRQTGVRLALPEVVEVEPDGAVMYRQQYVGPLSQRLRLHDFPLDTQTFSIHFVVAGARPGEIELVPGEFSADLKGGGMAKVLSLPDWGIVSYKAEARPYWLSEALEVPGFAFDFVAKRHFSYFIWQAALPLVLIVMMSWVPFWVDPEKGELQFAIAGSTVLTLIAFRFILARMLPPLPYLTRMDLLTISGTILVFGAFLQVVVTSLLAHRQRVRLARGIDHVCRVVFPIAFASLIVWSLFL
jgi:hypothetical protein